MMSGDVQGNAGTRLVEHEKLGTWLFFFIFLNDINAIRHKFCFL
jgi:hypothetical protein